MAIWWIILISMLLIFLWLGFREADREYMRCICGKQPRLVINEYMPGMRYHCDNCGMSASEGRTKSDAMESWHNLIKFHKGKKRC